MRQYEIWTEGYVAQGNSSGCVFHGHYPGNNIKEAIQAFKESLDDDYSKSCVDVENRTFWGCKIYDNYSDAANRFG